MDKAKIIDILGKNEMTVYEVGQLFEYVAKAFKEFENSMILNAKYAIEDSEGIVAKAKEMLNMVDDWMVRVEEKSNKVFRESEKLINDIYAQHKKFREKMESLPVFEKEFKIPYDLERLLKIAEQCKNLDNTAWQKVIELARVLK